MAKVYLMYENYKIDCTDPIGKGVFGEVYHCEPRVPRPDLPSHLAAKKIDISSEMDLSDLNEIKILAQMSHPNIIKFYDVVLTLKSIFVILEYADKGDLAKYVSESPGQRIPESDALLFLKQIAAGLYYTSSVNKVIHRDLKPANILISEDRKIKIADFGFARLVQGKKKMTKAIGSIFYMAPEVFNGKPYDFKCDVWSVGIMIYEFVYGCAPWVTGLEDPEHFKYIQDNPMVNFPEKKSICPTENFKDLIRKMLVYDPDKRIDWEQILNHKALKEHIEVEAKSYMKDILFNMMIVLSGKYDKFNVSFRQIYQMLSFLQNLVMTLTSTTATNTTVEKIFSIIWKVIENNEKNIGHHSNFKKKKRCFELNSEFQQEFKKACDEFIIEATQAKKLTSSLKIRDDEVTKVIVWLVYLRDLTRLDGKKEGDIKKEVEEMLKKNLNKLVFEENKKKLK